MSSDPELDAARELIASLAILGWRCAVCDSVKIAGEEDPRYMMCPKDAGHTWLVDAPLSRRDVVKLVAAIPVERQVVDLAIRTDRTSKSPAYRRRRLYSLTKHPGLYVREKAGQIVAVRCAKRTLLAERFTAVEN